MGGVAGEHEAALGLSDIEHEAVIWWRENPLWRAAERYSPDIDVPSFHHPSENALSITRPMCADLAVVDGGADFAAVAAVGVHDPDVRVFHGGLEVGESAPGAEEQDLLAIR